jgi:hypothetical protein
VYSLLYCIIAIKAQSAQGPVLRQMLRKQLLPLSGNRAENGKNGHTLAQIKQLSFYSAPYTNGLLLRGIQIICAA